MTNNPSLREEPRDKRAGVLTQRQAVAILDWLEQSGRLLAREVGDFDYSADDEEEINALMAGEDNSFDDDDDDDDIDLDD